MSGKAAKDSSSRLYCVFQFNLSLYLDESAHTDSSSYFTGNAYLFLLLNGVVPTPLLSQRQRSGVTPTTRCPLELVYVSSVNCWPVSRCVVLECVVLGDHAAV